ncbi:hypothetical protein Dsin_030023 [Dipteronia sinensis]|uniref:RRM domain-containing protein n=1 Tax=Dipteronia sinensis TaxID=43782 RepID=A0AAD9ZIL5_9ROSI|nr:hypothetical protein Dsin_030023 [Dipteronia sinensis]
MREKSSERGSRWAGYGRSTEETGHGIWKHPEGRKDFRAKLFSVFIDNLNSKVDVACLWTVFKVFGRIRDVFLSSKFNSRRKGFAFIRFESLEEASRVAKAVEGMHVSGWPIRAKVTESDKGYSTEYGKIDKVCADAYGSHSKVVKFQNKVIYGDLREVEKGKGHWVSKSKPKEYPLYYQNAKLAIGREKDQIVKRVSVEGSSSSSSGSDNKGVTITNVVDLTMDKVIGNQLDDFGVVLENQTSPSPYDSEDCLEENSTEN